MDYLVVATRGLVALVFVVSAGSKLRNRRAFDELVVSLRRFGVPAPWRRPVGVAVTAGEVAIPVLLAGAVVAGPASGTASRAIVWAGFALALALLTGFTAAIARAVQRGVQTPCRCFGTSTTPLGRVHLVRNGLLLAASVVGLVGVLVGSAAPSNLGGAAVALLSGLVAGALLTAFDDLVALFAPLKAES